MCDISFGLYFIFMNFFKTLEEVDLSNFPHISINFFITLDYKITFLVWGKNGDRYFLFIWVCWIQIYK